MEKSGQEFFEFRKLQTNEYYFFDQDMKTALSDYYAKQCDYVFGLYQDNSLLSYAITILEGKTLDIVYMFTRPQARRKGLALKLLGEICTYYKDRKRIHITDTFPTYKAVVSMAEKTGFSKEKSSTVYSMDINEDFWKHIATGVMGRIQRHTSTECLSFDDLKEEELKQIKNACENEFGNALLSPAPYIDNPAMNIDKSLSYALFRNGRLLAYTLISRPQIGHAVVEQIATAQDFIGKGLVLYPLNSSIKAAKEQGLVKKVSMTIMEDNKASKKLASKLLCGLTINTTNNENYYRY